MSVPGAITGDVKFACAMNEADPRLTRVNSNDPELEQLAAENCRNIGASHVFVIMIRGAWPINVLNSIKLLPHVASIYGATANPCKVIVAEVDIEGVKGRAVLGFADGQSVTKIETDDQRTERRELVKRIGYVLG